MLWHFFVVFACILVQNLQVSILATDSENNKWMVKGKCRNIWRPDKLVGKCSGLEVHSAFPELKDIETVKTAMDCRALCCNLETKCATWQYEAISKVCKLGEAVRLGLEQANTPHWCEPFPPAVWNGKRLETRDASSGACKWGEDLPTQCFRLGAERLGVDRKALSTEQCQEACCADKTCEMWQEIPGRGCYYAPSLGVGCMPTGVKFVYDGGRKCVPGLCGGLEGSILGNSTSSVKLLRKAEKEKPRIKLFRS